MSTDTQEVLHLWERLPERERVEVADFARFLLARHDDAAFERSIADPTPRPTLAAGRGRDTIRP